MNLYFSKKVLTTYLSFFVFTGLFAQDMQPFENPAYGPDSATRMECANNLSTMSEFMKIDLFDYALPAWREVFRDCPESSKNIYISGVKIYQKLLKDTRDRELRMAYYDTLMMIYDLRIEYFGEKGFVLGRKGMDIIRYNESDFENAYHAFSESVRLQGNEAELNYITGLIQTATVMQKFGKITDEKLLEEYLLSVDILNAQKKVESNPSKINRVRSILDKVIAETKIGNCEIIESSFNDKVRAENPDVDLIRVVNDIMVGSGCDNTLFYSDVNEILLEVDPDPALAYEVAKYNLKNDNFEKAAEFILKAINNEEDAEKKANYQYQLSVIYSSRLNKYQEAVNYAKQAIENRPGWGDPYFVIASAFIEGIKNCNVESFERQAVYWLAADYAYRAKNSDPSVEEKANDLISQYRSNYPNVEETFFRSLKEGDSYTIGCWISENTTVKTR